MKTPAFMIAGTHSGVGKTTITTAIMAALTADGLNVQPYKVGPDYIDPTYHSVATGNRCRNLDAWMLPDETLVNLYNDSGTRADISVIEGVMGVFDGSSGTTEHGSSAHIAKLLHCPVVLIVDVRSMARSAAAMVLGFQNFDPELNIAGVILNRIGSDRHLGLVTEAIEKYCGIPVVGYIRKNAKLELPSRHLGLIPTVEGGELLGRVRSLADEVREGIDFKHLLEMAGMQQVKLLQETGRGNSNPAGTGNDSKVRIGIAWDEAFSFYYQDGLETLEKHGACLVPFSPLHDRKLPEGLAGVYIGGGFPEIFLETLAENQAMQEAIRAGAARGMPIFAECGGLMYLTKAIVDCQGREFPMAGLVPARCLMQGKLAGMGYVEAESLEDNVIASTGTIIKGHEFHYSTLEPIDNSCRPAFRVVRNRTREAAFDGYSAGNILASYVHIHFAGCPDAAARFVQKCREYSE